MRNKQFIAVFIIGFLVITSCKKKKIDSNLNGAWILTELIIDGQNEVTVNTSHTLEFTNVEKGKGDARLVSVDAQGTYYTNGGLTIDKKYESMSITLSDGGYVTNLDGDFEVTETSFTLTGTFSNNVGNNYVMNIKGFK